MNEQPDHDTPTDRQQAYLRYLAARAHDAGMPHLDITRYTRRQTADWIDYLQLVVSAEERVRETLERARREVAEQPAAPYPPHPGARATPSDLCDALPSAFENDCLAGRSLILAA